MGKKGKENSVRMYVLDEDQSIIYGGKISDIKVKETYIIAKSFELYQNDAPCIIIRTKIVNRVYEMLSMFIKQKIEKEDRIVICIEEMPNEYQEALDFQEGKYMLIEISEKV